MSQSESSKNFINFFDLELISETEISSKDNKLDKVFWFKFFFSLAFGLVFGCLNFTGFFSFVL